jgi:hypothetical protein
MRWNRSSPSARSCCRCRLTAARSSSPTPSSASCAKRYAGVRPAYRPRKQRNEGKCRDAPIAAALAELKKMATGTQAVKPQK